ncbi:HGL093Cp [Eremothecium sinecaudum]|uniref:HGL093Cp n=1 Tax=Eremothecium sinecaudum TaxID=45286 RepID=A0A109V040_9SACH|nr:HGL093Cp [Eremothecium sinecaudum]AMD22247.1 HGL093Cp [Eremothecium sinecaudum]
MDRKLPEPVFELVREALNEERRDKRRKLNSAGADGHTMTIVDITGDDDDENTTKSVEQDSSSDEDEFYDSDEFEDVSLEHPSGEEGVLSVTFDRASSKADKAKRRSTVVDAEVRSFRKFMHCFHIVAMLAHYNLRNEWLNDSKLQEKLSALVPDKVFEKLNPEKDEEMPLRSTRKLLDGLKECMKLWKKHCKFIDDKNDGLYMWRWDALASGAWTVKKQVNLRQYRRILSKATIMSRKVALEGFVAMLRGCGVNARLVASLQPPDITDMTPTSGNKGAKSDVKTNNEKFEYPVVWCEVWDKFSKNWISLDPICKDTIEQIRYKTKFEPVGKYAKFNQIRYVIGFDRKGGCIDITRRYASNFNAKVRKQRVTRTPEGAIWYQKVIQAFHKRKRTRVDDYEEEYFKTRDEVEGIPNNVADLKNHPYFVLEKDMKQNETLRSGCEQCGFLRLKGTKKSNGGTLKVYKRQDVLECQSGRHWFMQGRVIKSGSRAVKTITVKNFKTREVEEERLYSIDQTERYVPPLVLSDGEIPVNAYGNIDVYKPWMIPKGCTLIESRHAIKAAAFVKVPFAKAVTGFSFEKGRSVKPKITGVVVQSQYTEAVCALIEAIECQAQEDKRKDREIEALRCWSLMLAQLRVKKRLNDRHGVVSDKLEDVDVETSENEQTEIHDGGFLPEEGGFLADPNNEPSLEPAITHNDSVEADLPSEKAATTALPNPGISSANEFEQFLEELNDGEENNGSGNDDEAYE